MRKLLFLLAAGALGSYLAGIGIAAAFGAPSEWLVNQVPTGRPPRFAALMAIVPIAAVGYVVLVVRLYRRWFGATKGSGQAEEK